MEVREQISFRAGYAGHRPVWSVPLLTMVGTVAGTVEGKDSCWVRARLVGGGQAAKARSTPRSRAGARLRMVRLEDPFVVRECKKAGVTERCSGGTWWIGRLTR